MGKSILILIGLWGFCVSHTVAQTPQSNQAKYWFYRYKLTNELLKKGESACGIASGFSIPAGNAYNGWPRLNFGDGTSYLGYYIGVLAMEHRLLANSGVAKPEQLARTKQELYYAMKAYERLDRNAELFRSDLQSDCNNNLNGFFMRDDVDSVGFYSDGIYKTPKNPINPSQNKPMWSNFKDTKDVALQPCTKKPDRFNSQDQISDLFVGFALVVRCMDNESYFNGSENYHFVNKAKEYTNLIMNHLYKNNYQIHVPNKNDNPFQNIFYECNAEYGGIEPQINAYGIARAGEGITEGNVDGSSFNVIVGFNLNGKYQNAISAFYHNWWQNGNGYPGGSALFAHNYYDLPGGHNYNNGLLSQFAAIGNSWRVGLVPFRAFHGSVKIPWQCSSANYACKTSCAYCSKWTGCNCRTICYPDGLNWWECPEEISASVWCYNNMDFAETFRNLLIAEINKILPQPLGSGITQSVKNKVLELVPNIQMCAPFQLPEISVNTTALSLSQYGNSYKTEPFALLHKYLYDNGIYNYSKLNMHHYLNTAPCFGPHRNPVGDRHISSSSEGIEGWRVGNRWQNSNESIYLEHSLGSYSGLDYMFLYNLYALVHGGDPYRDALDPILKDKTYPSNNEGTTVNRKYIQGYESITCSNTTVANNGSLSVRAGNSIKLSNFKAKSGAYFRAYTNPIFTCDEISNAPASNLRTEAIQADTLTMAQINDTVNYYLNKNKGAFLDTLRSKMTTYTTYETLSKYKQRNGDGVLARQETENLVTVGLYPNPANASITFRLYGLENSEAYTWVLADSYGQAKMSSAEASSSEAKTIPLDGLQMGVYHIQIQVGGTVLTQHFIKTL